MKEILLTKGQVALVDDADYDWLNQWKWNAQSNKHTFYANRTVCVKGIKKGISMHRLIMGLTDRIFEVDHRDRNGLNNQRANLRVCTHKQNAVNRGGFKNQTSKHKGVYFHKRDGNWRGGIKNNGITIHLGMFDNETDAAIAYNNKSIELNGEFAKLNAV